MPSARHILLVFQRELLDLRRERRVLVRLFLQPFVFIALMSAPAVLIQRAEARERATTFTIAVEGDLDAVPGLRDGLQRRPFTLHETDRAAQQVIGQRAELAVVVPDDAREAVRSGETVRLEVLAFSTQDASERAGPALTQRLVEVGRAESHRILAEATVPSSLASPLAIVTEDVATTSAEGVRFGIAQALPVLLVIQLFGLTTLAQDRIAGAKDKRVLEPLLVLPVPRRELLLGIGGAAMVVGAVSSVVIFLPLTLGLSAFVASVSRSLAGPGMLVLALAVGAITLALGFAALGLFLGARAGSGSEGSVFVTVVQLAVFATAIVSPFLTEVEARGPLLAVPVLGPLLFVRDGIAAGTGVSGLATLLGGQLAVAALLVHAAARSLDQARNVLRVSQS